MTMPKFGKHRGARAVTTSPRSRKRAADRAPAAAPGGGMSERHSGKPVARRRTMQGRKAPSVGARRQPGLRAQPAVYARRCDKPQTINVTCGMRLSGIDGKTLSRLLPLGDCRVQRATMNEEGSTVGLSFRH